MTDEEVGKLWRKYNSYTPSSDGGEAEACVAVEELIRKLVEDRAKAIEEYGRPLDELQTPHVELALRDFGIDPKEWK